MTKPINPVLIEIPTLDLEIESLELEFETLPYIQELPVFELELLTLPSGEFLSKTTGG